MMYKPILTLQRFGRQRRPNFGVSEIEAAHLLKTPCAKASAESLLELCGEFFEQLLAIIGTPRSTLFLLDDSSTDAPVGSSHHRVGRSDCVSVRRLDNLRDVVRQRLQLLRLA